MAVEYDPNGTPILTNDSLISDVPPYTQALAATGVGGGGGSCTVKDSKFNDLQPADPISPFPIGMLAPFMGENAPDGWLLCDGRSYDAAYFYALAEANPDFHSDGTFRVPDLRGRSPIGAANGFGITGVDPVRDIELGSRYGDYRTQSHQHWVRDAGTGQWLMAGRRATNTPGAEAEHYITGSDGSGNPHMIPGLTNKKEWLAFPSAGFDTEVGPLWPRGNGENLQPSTGVNFIVYAGRPTLDINGDILPECGQGAEIAPVTTRMMIEARLAEAGIGEEEIKMLKDQLEEIKKTEAK